MYVNPKEAKEILSVSDQTLRRWEKSGKIKSERTEGGHRRYIIPEHFKQIQQEGRRYNQIIYARVSSTKQSEDLKRQVAFLKEMYPNAEVITDIGSSLNYKRHGLNDLLDRVIKQGVNEVVVYSKDRLCRFGYDMLENIFKIFSTKIICVNAEEYDREPQQQLAEDLLSIITVFSARYHGARKYNKQKDTNKDIKRT